MSSNVTDVLPGVKILSDLLLYNTSFPPPRFVIDELKDTNNFLIIGLPTLVLWFIAIGAVAYYTDEDGFVTGPRRIESDFTYFRYFATFLTYIVEGTQVAAASVGPSTTRTLPGGELWLTISKIVLMQGSFFTAFPGIIVIEILAIVFILIPTILWRLLPRQFYEKFAQYYVHGRFGHFIAFMQDCFLVYLPLPFFIFLLRASMCEYYVTGEPPSALYRSAGCYDTVHQQYAIVGIVIAVSAFIMGSAVGTIPVLVERGTDLALNGRYMSISFGVKCVMAASYVLFSDRHRYYHLIAIFLLQMMLIFLNLSLRPCLVERINFHRSAAFILALVPTVSCGFAAGLDDLLSPIPISVAIASGVIAFTMLVLKYYALPSGKLFPAVPFAEGLYEGGLNLGFALPHGHGILRWEDDGRMFAGTFFFGRFHGYGVFTQQKYFFQGMHRFGLRDGFGITNIMDDENEEMYEGQWHDGKHHGQGTKKFRDHDEVTTVYVEGKEHGPGTWSFDTALGRHTTEGVFEMGVFTNVKLEDHEIYDGDLRFGVPHGLGKMTVDDDVFEGEWRAGKLHGNGSVRLVQGEYEGMFVEGHFNDQGTWHDEQETYVGTWKDGLKHGHGTQELESGTYEGNFVNGERQGYGAFTYRDGTAYQGSWLHNDYHGSGVLKTSDGAEYDGNWSEGRRHGPRGIITYPNGESYVGGWESDEYHGQGVLKIPDMGEFNGKFEFGKRHGLGRCTLLDGSEYVGDWADDFAQGKGHFVFASRKAVKVLQIMSVDDASLLQVVGERVFLDFGGVYDGEFVQGTMFGKGKVLCGDGTEYDGDWADRAPEGEGVVKFPDGSQYEGEMSGGMRNGIGTQVYPDQRLYRGSWRGNKRHGHGVMFSPNGDIVHDCEWEDDVPKDGSNETVGLDEAPEVDIDELLRVIMPSAASENDIAESRARRRLESEEMQERFFTALIADEEMLFRRLVRGFLGGVEYDDRRLVEDELREDLRMIVKQCSARLLNTWKVEFRTMHERDPKKSDILRDESIAGVYRRYMEMAKE